MYWNMKFLEDYFNIFRLSTKQEIAQRNLFVNTFDKQIYDDDVYDDDDQKNKKKNHNKRKSSSVI